MISLAGGPYIALRHAAAAGSTDWLSIVMVIAAFAIAVTVALVFSNLSTTTQTPRRREPADTDRKAA
jgi:hypothetical protein